VIEDLARMEHPIYLKNAFGEADPVAVKLCKELDAYALLGTDTDFIIYLSSTNRTSYIPLDTIKV
jgi:hypothetical protein